MFKVFAVSVDDLPPEVQAYYKTLVIFPEDAKIPESVLQLYWEHCPQGDYDPLDAVDLLVERSLLSRDKDEFVTLHDLLLDYLNFSPTVIRPTCTSNCLRHTRRIIHKEWHDDLFVLNDLLKDYLVFTSDCDMANLHKQLIEAYKAKYPGGWHTISVNDFFYFQKNWWNHAVKARVEVELVKEIAADLMTSNVIDHIIAFLSPIKDYLELADGDYYEIFSRTTGFNGDIDKESFNKIIAEGEVIRNIRLQLNPLKDLLVQLSPEKKALLLKQFPDIPFLEKALTTE